MKHILLFVFLLAISGCKEHKPESAESLLVITPGDPSGFVTNLDSYIDTIIVVPLENTSNSLVSFVSKMLILPEGNMVLSTPDHFLMFNPEGQYLFTIGKNGRGPKEYTGAADICLSQDAKSLNILTINKEIISYSAADGAFLRKVTLQSPKEHMEFDAIASGANGSFFVFSAQQNQDESEEEMFTLFHFDANGQLLHSALPLKDYCINMSLITQTYDNQYILRPQSSDNICYYLKDSLPIPRIKIDFGKKTISNKYSPDIQTYLRSDYYKMPIYIHETANQFYFTFCGKEAIEHYCVHSFPENKTIVWKRRGNDTQGWFQILASDEEFFYGIYSDYRSLDELPLAEINLLKEAIIRKTQIELSEDSNPALIKIKFKC